MTTPPSPASVGRDEPGEPDDLDEPIHEDPLFIRELPSVPRELAVVPRMRSTVPVRLAVGGVLMIAAVAFLLVATFAFEVRVLDDLALDLFAATANGRVEALRDSGLIGAHGDAYPLATFRFETPDGEAFDGRSVLRDARSRAALRVGEDVRIEYLAWNPTFCRIVGETVSHLSPVVAYVALGVGLLGAFLLIRAPAAHRRVLRLLTHGTAVQGEVLDVRRRGSSILVRYRFSHPQTRPPHEPETIPASRQTFRREWARGLVVGGPIAVLVDPDNPLRDVPPQLVGAEFRR